MTSLTSPDITHVHESHCRPVVGASVMARSSFSVWMRPMDLKPATTYLHELAHPISPDREAALDA